MQNCTKKIQRNSEAARGEPCHSEGPLYTTSSAAAAFSINFNSGFVEHRSINTIYQLRQSTRLSYVMSKCLRKCLKKELKENMDSRFIL